MISPAHVKSHVKLKYGRDGDDIFWIITFEHRVFDRMRETHHRAGEVVTEENGMVK